MYEITKTFTSGLLKGLTITETTKVEFDKALKQAEIERSQLPENCVNRDYNIFNQ